MSGRARWVAARSIFAALAVAILLGGAAAPGPAVPRPQDDFYLHVNRDWLAATEIPPTVPWISPYVEITLRVQARVRALVLDSAAASAPRGSDRQRIGDLYRSIMDSARIEALGLTPLAPDLDRIRAIASIDALMEAFAQLDRRNAAADPNTRLATVTPLTLAVRVDARNPKAYVATILPGGLGLPDRAAYTDPTSGGTALRDAYRAHIQRVMALGGASDPDGAAARILALETTLASAQLSEEALHDPAATDNPAATSALGRLYHGVPWRRLLRAWQIEAQAQVVLAEPAHLRVLSALLRDDQIPSWRDYLVWQLLRRYSPVLPTAFAESDFAFYQERLLGNRLPRPRDEQAALLVEGAFAEPLGRLYVERYLDPRAKDDVGKMAGAIRAVFRDRLTAADWLEPSTRAAAVAKLDKLLVKVGYPDRWQDFSDVEIDAGDLIGNLRRLSAHAHRQRMARLARPVDRSRWLDVPQSTSAYYNRSTNELAIPAGYLQSPWYDPAATRAANFGGIGTVIGHEMGHAFDDQGARFDGDGRLTDWWTPDDRARFETRITGLVRQYDRYEPLPGRFVNGRLTVSENVGDLTGVTLAHAALLRELGDASTGKTDAEERRFFTSFCTHWRARYREPLLLRILNSDGHPPQHYRCNGPLSNFAPFYRLYGIRPRDGMFRPETERVVLW